MTYAEELEEGKKIPILNEDIEVDRHRIPKGTLIYDCVATYRGLEGYVNGHKTVVPYGMIRWVTEIGS